ncbi:baculoviral IAP repeat-containing protein 7 [Mesoplodon densirostris]|uniref:baculoviral IAP repeat-containing protein 7 n=1 Tax=Mesoplodon densirostris TaxID=48708 RepID=UPI0028DB1F6D|nr:baculoviral IAP repeat-containing protein 7 [Mesoplodon densirostris]
MPKQLSGKVGSGKLALVVPELVQMPLLCAATRLDVLQKYLLPGRAQGSGALGRLAEHIPEPAAQGPIPATELVTAAVFSMGPEDGTKCWCCGLEPSRCAAGGRPTWGHHRPHSPCGHLQGQCPDSALSWGGRDHMDGQILGQLRPLAEEEEEYGAGDAPSTRPAFPGMGSEELRLASFYDWPLSTVVPPELLAAAGFFHTGQQDKVRCFFCYGGLQSWERGDDPWTEHARWFPRCEFLLRTKGRDFVCRVQESCCHEPGSWDRSEEPEDAGLATPSAPVHPGPELPTPGRQAQVEGAREAGGAQAERVPVALGAPGAQAAGVEEQLQRLQEERTCRVCLDRTVAVVFVPCGHLACTECAPSLQLCPICRAPIRSCVRTFLS